MVMLKTRKVPDEIFELLDRCLAWNSLPVFIRSLQSLKSYRSQIKAYPFKLATICFLSFTVDWSLTGVLNHQQTKWIVAVTPIIVFQMLTLKGQFKKVKCPAIQPGLPSHIDSLQAASSTQIYIILQLHNHFKSYTKKPNRVVQCEQ